jgi:hypothetical protein
MKITITVFILYITTLGLVDHIEQQSIQEANLKRHNTVCRSCPLIVKAMEGVKHESRLAQQQPR